MSDGLTLAIRPSAEDRELLKMLHAWWSKDDTEGGKRTKQHSRGRTFKTPLTGAGCKITCWPTGFPEEQRNGRLGDLVFDISFYAPASLMGNNVLPANVVRVPASAALATWKDYMLKTYRSIGVEAALMGRVTLEHTELRFVTFVYLWECAGPDEARVLHKRLYEHAKTVLDRTSRYRPSADRDKSSNKPKVRTDADLGETFYFDLADWAQGRAYIKVPLARSFFKVEDKTAADALFCQADCIVRVEIEVDIAKFRCGPKRDQRFPLNPQKWSKEFMPRDPFEVVWEEVRNLLAINGSLAKHNPTPQAIDELPPEYGELFRGHLAGKDLSIIEPDPKKGSRICRRLLKDYGVDCFLSWANQKHRTWSSFLGKRMRYANRYRTGCDLLLAENSLTNDNVTILTEALVAKTVQNQQSEIDLRW
jgi:hypothetical protein